MLSAGFRFKEYCHSKKPKEMADKNTQYLENLTFPISDVISNPLQIGGIETSVVDNGPGRGNRIAWVNTGSGLRYKVVIDRAMDIMNAFYDPYALAWISHPGTTGPNASAHKGMEWLRGFGGGLLTTCGLSHVGGPESDEHGERGIHGRISNLPAELISIEQPDLHTGKLRMSITGITRETTVFGPSLEIKRTIASTLGEAAISIRDEVRNAGNQTAPHMILYHCNFGWPLVDEGTHILWSGEWQARGSDLDHEMFNPENDFRKCLAPQSDHSGADEACAFIRSAEGPGGKCACGLYNPKLKLALEMHFMKKELPWLTNWQHWGRGEYVTALEPGTHPPIGQKKAREQGDLILLEPGETRSYKLDINVTGEAMNIPDWMKPDE
jgi:galactose mutarotase-like enzyme